MAETLLSASTVLLYGRVVQDVTLNFVAPTAPPPPVAGGSFLAQRLQGGANPADAPQLARIYAFSFEGHYYDLARPAIFLVHGPGDDPEAPRPSADPREAGAPADADKTGVAQQVGSFSQDMRVWSYDKEDFSIRMDVETGPLAQILLEMELRPERTDATYSGASAQISGASARLSGASARLSGASTRLRTRNGGYGD